MRKLMLIDENSAAPVVIQEVLNFENRYKVCGAVGKFGAEDTLKKEKPELILVNTDNDTCVASAVNLSKLESCPDIVLFGTGKKNIKLSKKPLDVIELPFDTEDFCERIEDAYFTAKGFWDPITGLFKKQCFDVKLERLMAKKTNGVCFEMGLNAYSYAANPSTPLQIQMAVYAMKTELKGAIFGINSNVIVGFLPVSLSNEEAQKKFEQVVALMCEAAGEPKIYITAGISFADERDYSVDDMLLFADKGMGLSRGQGSNTVVHSTI